jgi:thioredoxin reductase (NADPH)
VRCSPLKEVVMPDVIVIGDGPGGLSAALFLAKNQVEVVVFGQDKTAMNYALVRNYLGIPEVLGSEFQRIARDQVTALGATLRGERVETVAAGGAGWVVTLEGGGQLSARYLVLSEGKGARLATQLGLEFDEATGIATDRNARSSLAGVYIVGRSARPGRSQAIISAGDGAAAAIDILSLIKGESFVDWEEPPKS